MFEIYKKGVCIHDVYKKKKKKKNFLMNNEGGMTIGSKSIRQFTPRYSVVNNIVEEIYISLCLLREYS